ncbi:sugar transferase [Nostocaceae cyanobacterium CENA357]|uniref:Sugar transferase n=1 Tax=Atlanticothrix silvestris CENA357 TaxID=1725252 RepID=A0A8J7HHQ6_9CYAN|nr:sugar transferase [Atlanticothrix silvestris]MBH8552820.1 sugar transferase [Atlanticothrix silvestris CENA357]
MITTSSIPLGNLKSDLRSAKGAIKKRGLAIKILQLIALILLDATSLILAWKLAAFYETSLESHLKAQASFELIILIVQLGIIASKGLYDVRVPSCNYARLITAISLSNFFLLLIAFFYEPNFYVSRSTFIMFWLLSVVFICTTRFIFYVATRNLYKLGVIRYPVFLITDVEEQDNNVKLIEKENCYKLIGVAEASSLDRHNREVILEFLYNQDVLEVFVSWNAIKKRLYLYWYFLSAGITLQILPIEREILPSKSKLSMIGDVPCLTIPAPLIAGGDFWVKRCFDIVCTIILLLLLSPVCLIIALLIKLDSPGPVFFKQNRIGLHCKQFKIWKFRTMNINAEKLLETLEAKNEIKDGILFKLKDDPRITRIGKLLRLYSLDELPQLFNVLLGEMSLVGPRPHTIRDVERFQANHFIRQEVLPGITGLWQVSGRSNIDNFEDGVKLDIIYIENWSLWLDLKILLKTVKVVLQKTGAY